MADDAGTTATATRAEPPASGMTLAQYSVLVGAAAFVTTFAQLRILALYPTTFLLKEHFHMKQEQVAVFFFWATFAWSVKPLAGLLADAFPLFGTRRRHYLMLGSAFAGVFWILMGLAENNYQLLFIAAIAVNVATVFASTVMGGLMVEAGQAFGAPGRMTSLRQFVQSISQIVAPLLGGYLAGKAYGLTTGIAAGAVIMLAILVFFLLREKRVAAVTLPENAAERPRARLSSGTLIGVLAMTGVATWLVTIPDTRNIGVSLFALLGVFALIILLVFIRTANAVLFRAQGQLVQILDSRTLWLAAAMLFLVFTVPGLYTALTYQQSDILHFDKAYIGQLASMEAASGVVAAIVYGLVCRRLNLRALIVGGVGINALCTLLYLTYNHQTAPLVHIVTGFSFIASELALMDLAVRSTPRGCEALGFALMMSMRNFGLGLSDVLATKLVDQFHVPFNSLVLTNAGTTAVILLFIPLLPALVVNRRDGQ